MKAPPTGFATFTLDDLILGLVLNSPSHGYELYQKYRVAFGEIWSVGRSKFYAALAEMEKAELVTSTVEVQPNRPPRKIYQITEMGRQQFLTWIYQPVSPIRVVRVELIAKLRFFDLLKFKDAYRLIDAQLELCQSIMDDLQQHIIIQSESQTDPFLECVYDFRLRQARFIMEWLLAWRDRLVSPS